MAYDAPPARAGRRTRPPSWWWFAAPVVLGVLAVVVGAGAFVSLLHTVDTRYGEVRPDGEPHAISVPTAHRVVVMVPTLGNTGDWTCRVTDSQGRAVTTSDPSGTFTLGGGEASGWQSLLTFDPADVDGVGDTSKVRVYVACRTSGVDIDGNSGTVLVAKAPQSGTLVALVALMVLGPILLGGAALVWLVVLVVLQVVRRSGA
ncbi:hypothetical protein [Nocardioides marmoribigeumensis]|uniref:Uncharacterized protein n=1 Tax=Nocardioides marmoribigeumensis TaxID=433649 RepID=A0ABU2BYL6_9ACTN|nr:hypothetical protein [Nocardioides marmoribigeumensis]MDR7363496.1 hypothetical protein [Nocardioides marmoribigeumensis]